MGSKAQIKCKGECEDRLGQVDGWVSARKPRAAMTPKSSSRPRRGGCGPNVLVLLLLVVPGLAGVLTDFSIVQVASAKEIFVHPVEGKDTEGCGTYAVRCRTIGKAYDLAGIGDTILLAPGTYKDENDRNVGSIHADAGQEEDASVDERKAEEGSLIATTTNNNNNNSNNATNPRRYFSKREMFIVALDSDQKPVIDLEGANLLFDFRHVRYVTIRGLVVRNGTGKRPVGSESEGQMDEGSAAHREGGCMRFIHSNVFLEDVDFVGCTIPKASHIPGAKEEEGGEGEEDGGEGGSVYINNSVVFFLNCVFHSSAAPGGKGGAVFVTGSHLAQPYFKNCLFVNSKARYGGVASAHMEGGQITWQNCIFMDARASLVGGVMESGSFTVNIFENCRFENVSAAVAGGVLHTSSFTHTLIKDSEVRNSQAAYGGSVFGDDNSIIELIQVAFQNNSAEEFGGTLAAKRRADVLVNNVLVEDARALRGGGAIALNDLSKMRLYGGSVLNSSAHEVGGALLVSGRASLDMRFTVIANCSARWGGALMSAGSEADRVRIQEAAFLQNSAISGSALYVSSLIQVHNSSFRDNAGVSSEAGNYTSSIIYVEEPKRESVSSSCNFFTSVLNISSPKFLGSGNSLQGGYGIFWNTSRKIYGLCTQGEIIDGMGLDPEVDLTVKSKFKAFLGTGPQQALLQPLPNLHPGIPSDLKLRVVDGLNQSLAGTINEPIELRLEALDNETSFGGKPFAEAVVDSSC